MNQIDDDRVVFYLKHEKLIREWAAIEREAWAAVDAFLISLAEDIAALAHDLGVGVTFLADTESPSYPGMDVYRQSWCDSAGIPRVRIRLEWQRGRSSLTQHPLPYAGIKVNMDLAGSKELRQRILDPSSTERKAGGYTANPWWAGYRYVPAATGEYWADLSGHRAVILTELRNVWDAFSAYADRAVAEVPFSPNTVSEPMSV